MTTQKVTIPVSGELEVKTVKGILADATQIRYTRLDSTPTQIRYTKYVTKAGEEINVLDAITELYSQIVMTPSGFKKLYFTTEGDIEVEKIDETINIFNNTIEITKIENLDKIIKNNNGYFEGSFLVKLNDKSIGDLTIYQDGEYIYLIFITNYNLNNKSENEIRSYQRSYDKIQNQWTDWLLLNNKTKAEFTLNGAGNDIGKLNIIIN